MKTWKLFFGSSLLIAMSLGSCNKYEDGPAVAFQTKKARIANTWEVEQAMSDGEDVTDNYDQYTLNMTKDGDAELTAKYSLGAFSYEYETNGTWEFTNSQENLSLDFEDDDADIDYQILRLASDELWLREQGAEDELKLKTK